MTKQNFFVCLLTATFLCVGTPSFASSRSMLVTDSFVRADSGATQVENLGANWTTNTAGKFYKLLSNAVRPVDGANDAVERYSAITWPADQYAKVTLPVTSLAGVGTGYGIGCRYDTGGANTGYRLVFSRSGYELMRVVAGAATSLSSGAGTVVANGDTVSIECLGTGATVTIRMYKNDIQFGGDISDSNAARLLSGAAAITYSSAAGGSDNETSFEGGAMVSGGHASPIVFP